jgi:hypothetical protein
MREVRGLEFWNMLEDLLSLDILSHGHDGGINIREDRVKRDIHFLCKGGLCVGCTRAQNSRLDMSLKVGKGLQRVIGIHDLKLAEDFEKRLLD